MEARLVNRGAEGELLLIGPMDALCEEALGRLFDDMVQRYDRLIVNMAGVSYAFSPGLRLLKKAHLDMQKKGGELVITNVDGPIMEVLELAGLTGLLRLVRN